MTRRNTPLHLIMTPGEAPRAAPPIRRGLPLPPRAEGDLPPPGVLLEPEAIVDAARGHGAHGDLPIGAMLDGSPEAIDELELIAGFDDERDVRRSHAHQERLEMALDGALATLEDGIASRQ